VITPSNAGDLVEADRAQGGVVEGSLGELGGLWFQRSYKSGLTPSGLGFLVAETGRSVTWVGQGDGVRVCKVRRALASDLIGSSE